MKPCFLCVLAPMLFVIPLRAGEPAAGIAQAAGVAQAVGVAYGAPVELIGTHGKFDFIKVDPHLRRLLACHTGNGTLDVIDLDASTLLKSIPIGAAQGVAIDSQKGRYFVSVSEPAKLVIIDAEKLEVVGEVPLPGPADLVAYDPVTNCAFVCNDKAPEMWIIDPEAKTIVKTLTFLGTGMEDLGFDLSRTHLFQNLKDSSQVAMIDLAHQEITKTWSTLPVTNPHGQSLVPETGALLLAGGDGKLGLLDTAKGRIAATADIAQKVDEIAYDWDSQIVYCASGSTGTISVVSVGDNSLTARTPLQGAPGAHSIAVDQKTHAVWIAFAKGDQSFVQKIAITPDASSAK